MVTFIKHKFVDAIPEQIDEGIIYISGTRRTAVHLCICGCGNEVVTPFSPTDWQLTFNGDTISLRPSIGNWQFECRSHYFIIENKIINSNRWSDVKIKANRELDAERRNDYFNGRAVETPFPEPVHKVKPKRTRWGISTFLNLFK